MRSAIELQLDKAYHELYKGQITKDVGRISKAERQIKTLEDLLDARGIYRDTEGVVDGTAIRERGTEAVLEM